MKPAVFIDASKLTDEELKEAISIYQVFGRVISSKKEVDG